MGDRNRRGRYSRRHHALRERHVAAQHEGYLRHLRLVGGPLDGMVVEGPLADTPTGEPDRIRVPEELGDGMYVPTLAADAYEWREGRAS